MMLFYGLSMEDWKIIASICSNEDTESMSLLDIKAKYYLCPEYSNVIGRINKLGDKLSAGAKQ